MYGIDTFAINPEFVDRPLPSWGDMVDRQWRSRVALLDIPTITINIWAMYLARTGQIPEPGVIDNLTRPEVDMVMDWLTEHQRAGQFRAFWADYGTSVTLLASREVYVADIWNAAVFDARRAGVPAYYLLPDEGSIAWIGGESIFSGVDDARLPLIYQYLDHRLGGRNALIMAELAYQGPTYPSQETRNAFPPEFYGWNFEGRATYRPISEIVPGRPEWIANGLFDPLTYSWSQTAGTPHANGNLKDRGSIDNIQRSIKSLETWVDEAAYYIDAWTRFKAA
jgi:putative spermidine/putrescine transport system substrate-binding protein